MTDQSQRQAPGLLGEIDARMVDEGVRLASLWLDSDAERARRARLARWQQGTGNERDEQRRARQTAAVRAQEARSASDPRNSSVA